MDEFLAQHYNTLGYADGMEKEASYEESPWGYSWEDIEYAAQEKLAARYTPDAAARAKRDEFLRRRGAGPAPKPAGPKANPSAYGSPIGPTRGAAPAQGSGKFKPSDEMQAKMEEGKRRRAAKGPQPQGPQPQAKSQYSSPIGPKRPPASAKNPRPGTQYMSPIGPERPKAGPGILSGIGKRWKGMGRAGKAGVIAAGLAAAGAGGYGAYRAAGGGQEKKSSDYAFDQLVEEKAFDILAANGLADEYGNVVPPESFEKTAGYDDFDSVVDDAALGLLEQYGYPVERY